MGTVTRMHRFPHNFRHRRWYFQRMATMARSPQFFALGRRLFNRPELALAFDLVGAL